MKKLFSRIHPLVVAVLVVAFFFFILGVAYGWTRWATDGEIMGRVEVSGTQIGGMTRDQALSALVGVEEEHLLRPVNFTIDGALVVLDPAAAGFDADEEAVADAALRIGREGNAAYQFLYWLQNLFTNQTIDLLGSTDPDALGEVFASWEQEVIGMPASLGAIVLENGIPQPVYPEPGVGIDRVPAKEIVDAQVLAPQPVTMAIPTVNIIPKLTAAQVDEALLEANNLLGAPIRLVFDDSEIVFSVAQLTEAFRSRTIAEGSPQIIHFFDPVAVNAYLLPVREQFEAEPVNAEFVIEGDEVSIQPGVKGTRIDELETAQRLLQAGLTTARIGQLPLVEDADPEITSEYLESLNVNHLVSSFTTFHRCCESRVTNIQTFADTIDLHLMLPGDELSLNQLVGERTTAGGYVEAGTIVAGQLMDTVGGGVSQFATTFYNAVFWGGYEDIEHRAHSYYFSRYPEGIEATINWRTPDLVFRNNRESAILIDTQHTSTSITVRFFGDNDGRIVKGEQSGGRTIIEVVAEGGPNAWHVEGTVSSRYAETDPPPPVYIPNPEFEVEQVEQHQEELGGWSVVVRRTITLGGVVVLEETEWVVRYAPKFAVYEVHPCMVPETEETCPTTTTTSTTSTTKP